MLLTGQTPVSALKRKIDKARLVEPKDLNNLISDRTNQAILTGMKLDPKKRSHSMREWLDSLGLTGATPQPDSTVVPEPKSNWQEKINWTAIAAIGTFLSGIAALIVIFKQPQPPSPPSLSPNPSSTKTP